MASVIFDFDGTMADSLPTALKVYNEIAETKGYKPVGLKDWDLLRRMTITEGLKYVGIKPYHLPGLISTGRRKLLKKSDEIKLFDGIVELINKLALKNHKIFVLSTNAKAVVQKVLGRAGVENKVQVLSSTAVFGKASAIKQLIRWQRLSKDDVWMIGDELRDMQAAAKAKIKSIAVSWGMQPPDLLSKANPTAVAKKPMEILEILN